ncbi:MAG TPA: NAD(+) synthase [Pirellulales bacterium]|jgi:NAD+ synthase (glutamine-hydrolysing)
MQLINVGAAVLNQTPLAWDANKANILAAIAEARSRGISVLCLPELCITGYGCEDAFLAPSVQAIAWQVLEEILPETAGVIVSLGLPLLYQNALYDVACLAVDGRIAGITAKRFLAGDGIHYEPRWFKPWPLSKRAEITLAGRDYPLGDIHYNCGGVRIGFEICEDAWVANRPGAALAQRGVDIILNPSASHFAFGKMAVRERFVLEGSRAFGVHYIYANLVGNEAGRAIYDGGAMIASAGQMTAIGPRLSFTDWSLTSARIDIDSVRLSRARTGSFQSEVSEDDHDCVDVPFQFPSCQPATQKYQRAAWETGSHQKEEEFARAIALALFDYMRKSRSRGFVVSLSGGADSAAVSCLVALFVKFGMAELGRDAFLAKLKYFDAVQSAADQRAMVKNLLACVYQSTRHSGEVTRGAAQGVAAALGAEFFEFDVDHVVQDYIGLVSSAIGRELQWPADDLALQNIQARARSPGVWLLTNLRGALLASTSNRSEAAVGYATMDGDTSGGISPIAGIDKAFLRRWLKWLETVGPVGGEPIAALHAVNVQAPTAELRPPGDKQTDEADLMPYELLDAIERAAIRDKRSPMEVYQLMRAEFPHHTAEQMLQWIERFFRLWCRNQWKRERYAPSFHVDDENLDPKTWCRFPILSGGYERELTELREFVLGGDRDG